MTELQAILKLMARVEELEKEVQRVQGLANTWYACFKELESKQAPCETSSEKHKPLNLEETGEF